MATIPSPFAGTTAASSITGTVAIGNGGTGQTTDPLSPSMASDNAMLVWNSDWVGAGATNIMTAGTLYLMRVNIRAAITWTNVLFHLNTIGAGASTGSFVGLYNSAGTLLSGSADIGATLTGTTGVKAVALTSAQSLAAGTFVWVALLENLATTQATLQRFQGGTVAANALLGNASLRFAINGTGLTALPASITPASNTGVGALTFNVGGS